MSLPSSNNACLLTLRAGGTDLNPCWEHALSYAPGSHTQDTSPIILPIHVLLVGHEAQEASSLGQLSVAPLETPTVPMCTSYN